MYIQQLYTGCLAEAAYYIESNGEAAIIDPIRETEPYLLLAEQRGTTIKYIFETHFHADFVSGHIDLAKKTGATIVFGPNANTDYHIHQAKDGEVFELGALHIKTLHTPGHTPESTCYLLYNEEGKEEAIFTGDTLFVGDVGRPDLLDGVAISKEEQVSTLYDSLNNKIKTLPDHIVVYPAHGPGSMCGKSIGKETQSTIGKEKLFNYALQNMTREEFTKAILDGQLPAPQYFIKNATINRTGYESIDSVLQRNVRALSVEQVEQERTNKTLILDTRNAEDFGTGFIPGALNIGLDGSFAVWVGTLVDIQQRIVVVAQEGREHEAIMRLARVGYENVAGYLDGSFSTWRHAGKPTDSITSVSAGDFAERYRSGEHNILDVRRTNEYAIAHVEKALNLPLRDLATQLDNIDSHTHYYVHCAGGYRSMIAASILKAHGYNGVTNVQGGFALIGNTGIPIVEPAELTA